MDRINLYFRLRRYIKMLARRWFVLVISLLVCVGYSAHYAFSTPNQYRAFSKIGIAPKVVTPYDNKAAVVVDLTSFYETHLQYMQSSKVISKVEEKMRANRQFSGINPPVSPVATKGVGFFLMTVESTDFEYARQYAVNWALEFMSYMDERTQVVLSDSLSDNRKDIERYDKKLEKARQSLQDFQRRNNIASVKETADATQQRLDNLLDEYTAVQTLRQRLENKTGRELVKGGMMDTQRRPVEKSPADGKSAPRSGTANDPLDRFVADSNYSDVELRLRNKESEKERILQTLKPKHPFLQKLQADIDQLRRDLQYQLEQIEEKRLARIDSLKSDEESYKPLIENLRKQVFESRGIQNEYERLKGEETDVKADLENLRKAARSLEASNTRETLVHILEQGLGNPTAVSPDRRKIILGGLLLGLGLGLGIIYLLDRLDDRLELAEDIEAELEQPVLGQIPLIPKKSTDGRLLITHMEEHSMFAESLRVVRSAIMLGVGEGRKKLLVVTSAIPGDGKTTFTVNFAVTLAIAGHKVLLVDTDMRRGNVHNYFAEKRENGMSEMLNGDIHWRDVLKNTEVNTLKFISTGKLPGNPGELLMSPICNQFIKEASQEFDFIVFDCPPLTAIDDTFALVSMADGILFVVRAGQTSMRFAKNALMAVHQRGAQIFGVVLNGITADNPYYYYNHYYHGYYNKGQGSSTKLSSSIPGKLMASQKTQDLSAVTAIETGKPTDPGLKPEKTGNKT